MTCRRRVSMWVATIMLLGALSGARSAAQGPPQSGSDGELRGEERGRSDRFGRMFYLPPFAPPTPAIKAALAALGTRGSVLDAADNLKAGPINLIVDLSLSANNPDSDIAPAGLTFLGQFLDHDMTFDT